MKHYDVIVKNVYGTDLVYPACHVSKALCAIAGSKTLSEKTMREAKKIGLIPQPLTPKVSI